MNRAGQFLFGLLILAVPAAQAQLSYVTNDGAITITGYSGSGAVIIPTNINGLTVTSIAADAFSGSSVGSVTIPATVTSIGQGAFEYSALTSINIPGSAIDIGSDAFTECTSLTNAAFANGVPSIGVDMFASCEALASVTMPGSVSSIGQYAFESCGSLASITIPGGVTRIESDAFEECSGLTSVYFRGNAPIADSSVFSLDNNATVYYLPGTTGWSVFSADTGLAAVLWNPFIQTADGSFGLSNNQFGFNITGTTNIPIVVEACTNLASPVWIPLQTLNLTNGLFYFSEPFQTNSPVRFYRIGSP